MCFEPEARTRKKTKQKGSQKKKMKLKVVVVFEPNEREEGLREIVERVARGEGPAGKIASAAIKSVTAGTTGGDRAAEAAGLTVALQLATFAREVAEEASGIEIVATVGRGAGLLSAAVAAMAARQSSGTQELAAQAAVAAEVACWLGGKGSRAEDVAKRSRDRWGEIRWLPPAEDHAPAVISAGGAQMRGTSIASFLAEASSKEERPGAVKR